MDLGMGFDGEIKVKRTADSKPKPILYWRKFYSLDRLFQYVGNQESPIPEPGYMWKITKNQVLEILRVVVKTRGIIFARCHTIIPKNILELPIDLSGADVIPYVFDSFKEFIRDKNLPTIHGDVDDEDVPNFLDERISDEDFEIFDEMCDSFPDSKFGHQSGTGDWILDIFILKLELDWLLDTWNDSYEYIYERSF